MADGGSHRLAIRAPGPQPCVVVRYCRELKVSDRREFYIGVVCGLLAAIIWGGWPVVSKISIGKTLSAYDLNALRFGAAGLVLLPLFLRRGLAGLHPAKALVLIIGAGAPYATASVGGLAFAPAAHGGVVVPSTMLIFSTIGGALLLGDRPSPIRLAGIVVIVCGVLMIGWDGLLASAPGSSVWVGDVMFVVAGFLWATYTVAARAWSVEPLQATALIAVISMVLYLPSYALFADSNLATAPLGEVIFQAAYQGLGSAVLALIFYTRAVRYLGAARGAVFAALVPCIAVVLSVPVLGEIPTALQVGGVTIVTVGMVAALGLIGSKRIAARKSAPS